MSSPSMLARPSEVTPEEPRMPTVEENEREFKRMGLARVKILIGTSGLPQHIVLARAIAEIAVRVRQWRFRNFMQ